RHTTAHEMGHQFQLNQTPVGSCDTHGHDDNKSWCGNPTNLGYPAWFSICLPADPNCGGYQRCVMSILKDSVAYCQRIDTIDRFDCSNLLGIGCPGVTDNCSGTPPVSIRTDKDPE